MTDSATARPESAPSPTPSPRRWLRRLLWSLGGLVALLAVLTGLLTWWLPDWARPRVEAAATEALGTPVRIGRIELQPWRLDLRVSDVQVGSDEAPLACMGLAHLQLAGETLWRLVPVVQQLELVEPEIWLRRETPERTNLTPLLEHLQARAAAAPPKPEGAPARFALHNIELRDGRIHLQDDVLQQRHEVEALQIGLPFLSNLPSDVQVVVQPKLEARIDGSSLGLGAEARPFAPGQPAQLHLGWKDLALPPWLGAVKPALPAAWLPTLASATLDTDLRIEFERPDGQPRLVVKGDVEIHQLDVAVPAQGVAARWKALKIGGLDLAPLAQQYRVGSVEFDALEADYRRSAAAPSTGRAPATAPTAPAASAPAPASEKPAAAPQWQVGAIRCRACAITLQDGSVQPAVHLAWRDIALEVEHLSSDGAKPIALALAAQWHAAVGTQPPAAPGSLKFNGELKRAPLDLQADLKLDAIDLAALQPYLAPTLNVVLQSGRFGTEGQLALTQPAAQPGQPAPLAVRYQGRAGLAQLALQQTLKDGSRTELLRWQQLDLAGLDAGWQNGAVSAELATLDLTGLDARALLRADGTLNVADLVKPAPTTTTTTTTATTSAKAPPSGPKTAAAPAPRWHVGQINCRQCAVQFRDQRVQPASRFELQNVALGLKDLSSDTARTVGTTFDAKLVSALDGKSSAASTATPGRLSWRGTLRQAPLKVEGDAQLDAIDLAVLQPYLAPYINLVLTSGQLGTSGRLALDIPRAGAAPLVQYTGKLALDGFRTQDGVTGDDFVNWQQLGFDGLAVKLDGAAVAADLGRVRIDGLDARVILQPDGHPNLADVMRRPSGGQTSLTTPQDAASAASAPPAASAPEAVAAAASAPAPAASAARPDIRWQGIAIERSEVHFSDYFIRPNYSARLTKLQGSISALSAASPEPAQIRLDGALDDGAPLHIAGTLNPLGARLYTDIEASARGIALPRLSAYAERYTGYGIEKGSLSVKVSYSIDQGRLKADHNLYLDQLTFGERVERPDVTHLPVLLAVALLKDRHGVIDLSLPVAGTLDDPQFSIGGIVWQVLKNLIGKAVTAPFSLLMGDGAEDSGRIDFAPGSAELSPIATDRLDALAAKLKDRPGVRVETTGSADPVRDAEALLRARAAAAAAAVAASGPGAGSPGSAGGTSGTTRRAATAPASAASAAGPAPVTPAELQTLADQRATKVMAYLSSRIEPERLLMNRSVVKAADQAQDDRSSVELGLR